MTGGTHPLKCARCGKWLGDEEHWPATLDGRAVTLCGDCYEQLIEAQLIDAREDAIEDDDPDDDQ